MNRFHLLFTLTLLITINGYSQLNKKIWLVGGTGSYNSYTSIYTSTIPDESMTLYINDIKVSAKVGYFVTDKLVFGITPTYSYEKAKESNNTLFSNRNMFSAGPFARYYFLNKNKPFNLLTEINSQFSFLSSGKISKEKSSVRDFSILVGPEIFFNPTVGIEILLGYKLSKEIKKNTDNPYTMKQKGFQVAVGFQIHLKNNN
jgi:hypothetical protein